MQERLFVRLRRVVSGADEAGVERAGHGWVGGALDEGATVRKDSEGVRAATEAEEHRIGAEIFDI